MTSKQVEKKYNCQVLKDNGFDDKRKYWVALGKDFDYADGWTLDELVKNIEKQVIK